MVWYKSVWTYLKNSFSSDGTCKTNDCYASAEYLKASMNLDGDPCDDFYHFACGRFEQNHLKAKKARDTISDRVIRNSEENRKFLWQKNDDCEPKTTTIVRSLFLLCVTTVGLDMVGVTPIRGALKSVQLPEYPPMLSANPNFDLLNTTTQMQKLLGIEMFFSIGVDEYKPRNVSKKCISIRKPKTDNPPLPATQTPPIRSLQDQYPEYATKKQDYILMAIYRLCGESEEGLCASNNLSATIKTVRNELDTYLFELYKIKNDPYHKPTLFHGPLILLQSYTDKMASRNNATALDWSRILRLAFPETPNIEDMEIVADALYMGKILTFIYQFPLVHELGAWWTVVEAISEYSSLHSVKSKILNTYVVGLEEKELWCEKLVNHLYGPIVSFRYNIDPTYIKTKSEVQKMVENIRQVFSASLNDSAWMDKATKTKAMARIQSMETLVAFPSSDDPDRTYVTELDDDYLHLKYEKVGPTLLDNVLLKIREDSKYALDWMNYRDIQRIKKKKFFYTYSPLTWNPTYISIGNSFVLPAGLLGPPIYWAETLAALNYGSIGASIGHEMAHALHASTQVINSSGHWEHLWENGALQTYQRTAKCFIESYYRLKVDGVKTISENIADNVGFSQALKAYRAFVNRNGAEPRLPHFEDFTQEQLFTLGFANFWCKLPQILEELRPHALHSPFRARLLGVLRNSADFARIWNCPVGAEMNKNLSKCHLW